MKLRFLRRKEVARETMTFYFVKPAGFKFLAGQFLEWTVEGNTHPLTLSSAPFEKDLSFTTRLRDTPFKNFIKTMPVGTFVDVVGPEGDFVLPKVYPPAGGRPLVFLAGGIGITPFRSMILQSLHDKLPQEIYLFYSNHSLEETAFLEELTGLAKENPQFHFISVVTRIDESLIKKFLPDFTKAIFYAAGPPAMVKAMRDFLLKAGVKPENLKLDMFSGY